MNTGPLTLIPGDNCAAFAFIGSQVIPGAATEKSDTDIAVLLVEGDDGSALHSEIMMDLGGENGGSAGASCDGMESYKVEMFETGHVWNYLIFTDINYFNAFVDATTIAKRFGVVDKPFRVELFQLICDGARYNGGHFEHIKIHHAEKVPF